MVRRYSFRSIALSLLASVGLSFASDASLAQGYVTTGQTGAQTQIDSAPHTTTIYLSVTGGSATFGGASLTVKRGSATTDSISFNLFSDTTCGGTPLETVTLQASSVSTQFTSTLFQISGNRTLSVGNYCTTVTSTAPDVQSKAFFIKGADSCQVLTAGGNAVSGVTCSTTLPPATAPDLSISKAQPTPGLTVGVDSTYVLTVTNTGTAAATTARVQDQLPSGLSFVSATGTNWSCSNASGLVTCNFSGGSIASGGGTSTINVVANPTAALAGQSVTNYAAIDPTGGTAPPTPGSSCSPAASCASAASTVAAATAPDLSLTKSAPSPGLDVGQQSTYALTVVNGGAAAAATVQVKDQLPAELLFVSAGGAGWSCSNAAGLVTCNLAGSLAVGDSRVLNVTVRTSAGTTGQSITNYASVDPTGGSNAPAPGPSCSAPGACASSTASVKQTKDRTEAAIQNFLAKRGSRLASNGLALDRVIGRLTDECDEVRPQGPKPLAPYYLGASSNGSDTRATMLASDDAANAGVGTERRAATDAFAGAGELAQSSVEETDNTSDTSTGGMGFGPLVSGTREHFRMNLTGSLAKASNATGPRRTYDCAERKRRSLVDVWFDGTYEFLNFSDSEGHFGLLKLGVDYRVANGIVVGVLAQFDTTRDKSASLSYRTQGNGWMAGPYAAARLGDYLYFDTSFLWGTSENEVSPFLTYTDEFTTERWLATARLSGRWEWNGVAIAPAIEYVHFTDESSGYTDATGISIASQRVDIDRLIFGPEFRYGLPVRGSGIESAEFNLAIKGLWDFDPLSFKDLNGAPVDETWSELHARFDLGVTLRSQSGVSSCLGIGFEGLGGDGFSATSINGNVRIPLN